MATKMHNPETGETVRVPGRRVKDHLQNGYEIADGSEVPVGNVQPETGEDQVTKEELYEQATALDVKGRSKMTKEELQDAIEKAEDEAEAGEGHVGQQPDAPAEGTGDVIDVSAEQQVPANLGEVSPDVQAEVGTDL